MLCKIWFPLLAVRISSWPPPQHFEISLKQHSGNIHAEYHIIITLASLRTSSSLERNVGKFLLLLDDLIDIKHYKIFKCPKQIKLHLQHSTVLWCSVICETVTIGAFGRYQVVDVKGTAVLHPNETCFLTAPVWALGEADGPFYFSLIHCRMISTQPAWICRTARVIVWTLSRHCYSWNVQETIPIRVEIFVTFCFIRVVVAYVSIIIV